jgi:hypothetical protein
VWAFGFEVVIVVMGLDCNVGMSIGSLWYITEFLHIFKYIIYDSNNNIQFTL